jgi:AAA family ATP:ADP antiporter
MTDLVKNNKGVVARIAKSLSSIEPNELKATGLSFLFVAILMIAYYLLRPVRDAMASDWTDAEVSWLWTLNFFISAAIVAVYGFAVSRIQFRKLIPSVYAFFASTFVVFFLASQVLEDGILVDKIFYVWVSVFALFHLSTFWSFMADTFNKDQSKRLFSIISAGASIGAVIGPLMSGVLATRIGTDSMMLISAALLIVPIPIILYLARLKQTELGNEEHGIAIEKLKIGGNFLSGFKAFVTNPYLLGIGIFIIAYTGIGTFVYFEQKNLLEVYDLDTRAAIYGYRDAVVNTITYLLAFFLTGRLVSKLGMPVALAIVPVCLIFGMLILSFSPVLMAAVAMHVALRAGNYGLTRPAREMLFTVVDRDSRFKAKPVIDIVAYRGGDVAMGALLAAIWGFVAYLLGRSFETRDRVDDGQQHA